jgi:hypothetical protein
MAIVARVGAALQPLFGPIAEAAARDRAVIARRRQFTARSLARTFVGGSLQTPAATDEDLAQVAAQCGAAVPPPAVGQRHTPRLVAFLEGLFRRATGVVVGADRPLAPLLERFPSVTVLDRTTIALPDGQRESFPGCGGGPGGGAAALKLPAELDLRSGALSHVEVEAGRRPDGATVRQWVPRPAGSLRITDLGSFSVAAFAALVAAGAHFLSRRHDRTGVRAGGAGAADLRAGLPRQPGPLVDRPVRRGPQRLACRRIAWRLPPEQAARRRRELRRASVSKYGRAPSRQRLAWCDWTVLVTSAPAALLAPREAAVLYRARWQVELLVKRWKSQDLVAVLRGSTEVRQMVRVWARLLAAPVQHGLVVAAAWGDPARSWGKVAAAVRPFVGRLLAALDDRTALEGAVDAIRGTGARTCRRDPRSRPGTVELLNDPRRLDYRLT